MPPSTSTVPQTREEIIGGPERELRYVDGDRAMELVGTDAAWGGSVPTAAGTAGVTVRHFPAGYNRVCSVFTFTDVSVATVDDTTSGAYGTLKFFDFPEGRILVNMSRLSQLTTARVGTSIVADATFEIGVGTVASAAGGALTTTEEDILLGASDDLVAGTIGPLDYAADVTHSALDGTSTPIDAYVNIGVAADADHGTAADAFTLNGQLIIEWQFLGDA